MGPRPSGHPTRGLPVKVLLLVEMNGGEVIFKRLPAVSCHLGQPGLSFRRMGALPAVPTLVALRGHP